MHLIAAVEAINGGSEMHGFNGVSFWNKQLNIGYRLAGIGGSDNHNAMSPLEEPSSVGSPTTVVYATELSVQQFCGDSCGPRLHRPDRIARRLLR